MATKNDTKQRDFVEHGSKEHAALLGLIPDDKSELGYRLADMTAYGPQASPEYMKEVLRQKVSELKGAKPSVPTSAPRIFTPDTQQ